MSVVTPDRFGYSDFRATNTVATQGVAGAFINRAPKNGLPKTIYYTTPGEHKYYMTPGTKFVRVTLLGAGGGTVNTGSPTVVGEMLSQKPAMSGQEITFWVNSSFINEDDETGTTVKVGNGVLGAAGESSGFFKVNDGFLFEAPGGILANPPGGTPFGSVGAANYILNPGFPGPANIIPGALLETGGISAIFSFDNANWQMYFEPAGNGRYGGGQPVNVDGTSIGPTASSTGFTTPIAWKGYGGGGTGGIAAGSGATQVANTAGVQGLVILTEFY